MKKILIAIILLSALVTKAQQYQNQPFDAGVTYDFEWGDYDHANFNLVKYGKDPTAHAVILKEFGKAWLTSNGNVSTLIFEYHVKIKLFDNQSLDQGRVEIPYYIQDNGSYEEINPATVKGITYYASKDGAIRTETLNQDSIAIVKKNKHWNAIVFSMPHLTKGCIIEYRYRLTSPYLDKFKTWEFQSTIPKIYSEYEVHIPNVFNYYVSLRGSLALSKDTVSIEKNCFASTNMMSDCRVEDYRINDVPSFKPETFISSPKNYLSALYFQVARSAVMDNYSKTTALNTMLNNNIVLIQSNTANIAGSWENADKTLMVNDNFGQQLSNRLLPKDKLEQIISGSADTLEKAKALFAYIQKNIVFDGLHNIYTDNGVKKSFDKHTGNSADINLALTDAFKEAGITADAVIISTRDNGMVNNIYPALTEFNSVITAVSINNKTYLLDATDPLVPFGILPFKDLTDKGRVIPLNKPSYWINLFTTQRNISTTAADLTFDGTKIFGTITCYSKNYGSYQKRKELLAHTANNPIIKGLTITGFSDNSAEQGNILIQTYHVQIDVQNRSGAFTLTPFMLGKPVTEPFELTDTLIKNPITANRSYAADIGMPAAHSFTFNIQLPAGYIIANPPQDLSATISGIGNMEANFNFDKTTAAYTISYSLDKAVYTVAECDNLRMLFEKILAAEKASVTIKKE